MALVDYSDSESDSEVVEKKPAVSAPVAAAAAAAAANATKKPFHKLLDRGKILVNLPTANASADTNAADDRQPSAKRAKTTGGSRFGNFASLLPPPKKAVAAAPTPSCSARNRGSAPAPGVHLKTGAEPAFIRGGGGGFDDETEEGNNNPPSKFGSGLNLPEPKKTTASPAGPSIPEGMKPEEEVKFVGKPLMFKPLSVARRGTAAAKKKKYPTTTGASARAILTPQPAVAKDLPPPAPEEPPQKKKKISLFSMGDDDETPSAAPTPAASTASATSAYQPLFTHHEPSEQQDESDVTSAYPSYPSQLQHQQPVQNNDLSDLADSMSLSAAARRELFGRSSASSAADIPANAKIIEFNMEQEYAQNEMLRQSGEQVYNPVRSIQPGKHSLRQVVNMAQNNQSALEDAFAQGRASKRDAAGRYGWK